MISVLASVTLSGWSGVVLRGVGNRQVRNVVSFDVHFWEGGMWGHQSWDVMTQHFCFLIPEFLLCFWSQSQTRERLETHKTLKIKGDWENSTSWPLQPITAHVLWDGCPTAFNSPAGKSLEEISWFLSQTGNKTKGSLLVDWKPRDSNQEENNKVIKVLSFLIEFCVSIVS